MIVYYNQSTFDITGMSYQFDLNRTDPYIETSDPLAEKIFLGKEKSIKHKVVITPGVNGRGVIRPKTSAPALINNIAEKVYKVYTTPNAEITFKQDTNNKTMYVEMSTESLDWWKNDPFFGNRRLHIAACKNEDPYKPLWVKSVPHSEFEQNLKFDYTGEDNFTIYTVKIFESYSHEITSV